MVFNSVAQTEERDAALKAEADGGEAIGFLLTHFVWVPSALTLDGEQDNAVFSFHGGGYSVTLSKFRISC